MKKRKLIQLDSILFHKISSSAKKQKMNVNKYIIMVLENSENKPIDTNKKNS